MSYICTNEIRNLKIHKMTNSQKETIVIAGTVTIIIAVTATALILNSFAPLGIMAVVSAVAMAVTQ